MWQNLKRMAWFIILNGGLAWVCVAIFEWLESDSSLFGFLRFIGIFVPMFYFLLAALILRFSVDAADATGRHAAGGSSDNTKRITALGCIQGLLGLVIVGLAMARMLNMKL